MAKITYQEGMEILKSMFDSLDEETLKSVLVMNRKQFLIFYFIFFYYYYLGGKLEPTIEALLKLTDETNNFEQEKY